MLGHHPDDQFTEWVLSVILSGFRIGFDHSAASLRSTGRNMPSAYEHPMAMEEFIC